MQRQYIELTITSDSSDSLVRSRKACVGIDQIATFVDVSEMTPSANTKVKLTLTEPGDYINTDDDAGGVVRAQRTLYVQEDYATVKRLFESASGSQKARG